MYQTDTTFSIALFSRQDEEADSVIGPDKNGLFLSISSATAEVLALLSNGYTFNQVCDRFCGTPDDVKDLEEVLIELENRGLIVSSGAIIHDQTHNDRAKEISLKSPASQAFSILSVVARLLFHRWTLCLYAVVVILGAVAAALAPWIIPGPSTMVFSTHRSEWILFVVAVNLVAVAIHEVAHFLAARAVGVAASFGIGNRLWILVAETDLSGIWTVPRRRRYVPLLAGCIWDAVTASLLLCVLYLNSRFIPFLSAQTTQVVGAVTFTYFTRILWQCFFFLRTDFYYVFSTAFHCTNLMAHTRLYLSSLLVGLGRGSKQKELNIPHEEVLIVRRYLWFWLFGHVAALWVFLFVSIPVSVKYIATGLSVIGHPSSAGLAPVADTLGTYALVLCPWLAGVVMWARQLSRVKLWTAH